MDVVSGQGGLAAVPLGHLVYSVVRSMSRRRRLRMAPGAQPGEYVIFGQRDAASDTRRGQRHTIDESQFGTAFP